MKKYLVIVIIFIITIICGCSSEVSQSKCEELFPCTKCPDVISCEGPDKEQCEELYPCTKCPEVIPCKEPSKEQCEELYPLSEKKQLKLGIDLIDNHLDFFSGKNVGLITNQTGINSQYQSTIDVLYEKVKLVKLFAPEHGIRGNTQAGGTISNEIDVKTGLPVYSLYGSVKAPTEEMLSGLDVICFDIQDVGARFYTYIYTMARAMQSCALYGVQFVVFDRPNPVGDKVEGNILDIQYSSDVGLFPIVQRHGMTVGELAKYFNVEEEINCDLTVIEMEKWDRTAYYDDTNMPWIAPSPNMPTVKTASVYLATCVFEGTNLSEGRGTTTPFEVIGAPFIDPFVLANALNRLELPGVYFRPAYFTPSFSKNANVQNGGVFVHITDRNTFESVYTGWAMLKVIRTLYPNDFQVLNQSSPRCMLNLLTGCNYITNDTYSLAELRTILVDNQQMFSETRANYLLY